MMILRPGFKFVFSHPAHFIAFGFGAGLSRFAPGTAGTLVGFPIYWLIAPYYSAWEMLALIGVTFVSSLLGSADIIAQMADRCYLEKCRDRLDPEFLLGGLTTRRSPSGEEQIVYASGEDLVRKTPLFYTGATRRLDEDLQKGYAYAESHFHGQNLYLDEMNKNMKFVQSISKDPELAALRRQPPDTLKP